MKKIFIFKFDPKIGPQLILLYPPKNELPSKELLLQIWGNYELKSKSILFELKYNNENYCVIGKPQGKEIIFIVTQLSFNDEFNLIRNIFIKLSESLFSQIEQSNFSMILADLYKTFNEFSLIDRNQLFFNFFSDKNRINLFNILKNGVIDRISLLNIFKEEYGISESNFDLILIPFFNLNLIIEKDLPGIKKCYFLINDVFFCRIPCQKIIKKIDPINNSADKMYLTEIFEYFKNYSLENEEKLYELSKIFSNPIIYNSIVKLYDGKIKEEEFLSYITEDFTIFSQLIQEKIIIEIEDYIYPMAELNFIEFKPFYIINSLKKRFEENNISIEQFFNHIDLLQKYK